LEQSSTIDVALMFLDRKDHNIYQLRQWLQPLERLAKLKSVSVIYSSDYVTPVLKASRLTGHQFRGQDELIENLYRLDPKVILYPNQNVQNFYPLRFPRAVHVFVSHGESDKAYMAQNTIKRYDLYFAAGEAAKERILKSVSRFDVSARIFEIGRPQSVDSFSKPSDLKESVRKRILYAPTWEGVTRATRYTSIASHGLAMVKGIIESGNYQLCYRPHPLSGSRDTEIRKANSSIIGYINAVNRRDHSENHYVDTSEFGWQLDYHDLMISDISAIAYDWLSTAKPILLTKPIEKMAVVEEFPIVERLYSIGIADLPQIDNLIARQFDAASGQGRISKELGAHYFRQPMSKSDSFFLEALERAEQIRDGELSNKQFPRLEGYVSRGGPLGTLRYPNFLIREVLRMAGTWSTTKQIAGLETVSQIFVHLTDPFNAKSLLPPLRQLLSDRDPKDPVTFMTNQVTNLLAINKLVRKEFPKFLGKVRVIPVTNAAECELVVNELRPNQVLYLKHHPLNHMLLRLNGISHILWRPDLDPLFRPDHTLVTYDYIASPTAVTATYIEKLPWISKPEIVQ
jgi:hypothetical protein